MGPRAEQRRFFLFFIQTIISFVSQPINTYGKPTENHEKYETSSTQIGNYDLARPMGDPGWLMGPLGEPGRHHGATMNTMASMGFHIFHCIGLSLVFMGSDIKDIVCISNMIF